ncbi:hypothetical protein AAG906_005603 [Vitis piasezkii]
MEGFWAEWVRFSWLSSHGNAFTFNSIHPYIPLLVASLIPLESSGHILESLYPMSPTHLLNL